MFFLLVASGILFLPKFSLADGVIIQTPAQGHTVSITHTVSSFDIGTAAANVTIANTGMWISFNPGISQANFCGRSDFGVLDINLHDNTTGQDAYSGQLAFDQGVYGTTGLSHIHDVTAGDDIRIDLNCDPSSATTTITAGITDIPSVYWWNGSGMTQPQYDAMIAYMTSQLTVSSLHQYKSDASTNIAEGGLTTENSLVIKGIPTVASGTDQLRLELEVQPFATAFTGTATATSAATSSGNVVSLTIPSLANNHYHWRARVFDTTTNATSSWEEFGTSGNADFTIHAGGNTADLYYPVGYQWISKNAQYCYDHFSTSSPACSGVTSATSSDNVYWGGLVSDNTAISFSGYVSMLLYDASSTSQCASGWWGHTQDIVDASGTLTDVFDGSVAAVGGVICHNAGGAKTISGPLTSRRYVVVWQDPAHKCADESLSQCLADHGGDSDFSLTTLSFDPVSPPPDNARSIYLDGSSALGYSAANVAFTATDPFTIELWYRSIAPSSTVMKFIDTRSGQGKGFFLEKHANDGIEFFVACDSGEVLFHGAGALADDLTLNPAFDKHGVWHHVAITKDSGTSWTAFKLYFDGISQSISMDTSNTLSGSCFNSTSSDAIWFGQNQNPSSTPTFFTGNLDEVRIWNVEKSVDDIKAAMATEATSTAGLLALWQFNNTSTNIVTSDVASGQDGMPVFATSTPFGHFLIDQTVYPTSVRDGQLLYYSSGTSYGSEMSDAASTWNALGDLVIASTTSALSANVVVSDVNSNSSDYAWEGAWTPYPTSSLPSLRFNHYYTDSRSYDEIMHVATHELGHAIGLDHSFLGNIMNYYVTAQTFLGGQDQKDYFFINDEGLWGN
ncbi:hypothetical protein AYO50_01445 [Acidobacteria bacterium SCGC AG-212-P17]|nr:hypothetical protein AYO50_01445 [Acidobacteria bacterium SCGC AG-212-P17]